MIPNDRLGRARREYAKRIVQTARSDDARLEQALADLPRENFLPPGPWLMQRFNPDRYEPTQTDDPIWLYQDAAIAILSDKRLNTGHPSFLVSLIAMARVRDAERVVHIGTGLGYYTAVISRLVGGCGHVMAIEYEAELAARTATNLTPFENVRVVHGNGATIALEPADVIFVNAGASRPVDGWLDALKPGGRLILPLTVSVLTERGNQMTRGTVFLIERETDGYLARAISSIMIYPCVGARDEASEAALRAAFARGGADQVTRLRRSVLVPPEKCWLRAPSWSLTYD
jgi:protein-L-isoaspartate(D-aspartate) O-methyltransferase